MNYWIKKIEAKRIINFAKASLYHWKKSDKYTIVNEQRGKWLISHVYAILGKSDEALSYAQETLKITEENNLKDFDLAYAYESMARAHSIANNQSESKEWYKKAKVAGDLIANEKDKIMKADLYYNLGIIYSQMKTMI